ncbi:hypothetical protein IG631_23976 [Alternaria alternata]|nr:hypothetical protein IG631_23976 [Alternaria alternata]
MLSYPDYEQLFRLVSSQAAERHCTHGAKAYRAVARRQVLCILLGAYRTGTVAIANGERIQNGNYEICMKNKLRA